MSLSVTLRTATSGLQAAQAGLNAVSNNIANVNTPGYVRTTINQQPLVVAGAGQGVQVNGLKRITDQYLEMASQTANADSSRWSAYSQNLDTAQGLFGDPSGTGYFFNGLDNIYSGFAAAANDPSSSLLRSQATANIQSFLSDATRINDQLNTLGSTMDTRISSDVSQANSLLKQIDALNSDISRAKLLNQDSSGAENQQGQLVSQLTSLMGVKVSERQNGGVDIRSPEGIQLAGDGAAQLTYNSSSTTPGYISVIGSDGVGSPTPISVSSGEVRGLMDMRNTQLPQLTDQLGEFVQRATQQLNDAHNASTAVPAPATLTGRNTGLDMASAVENFTGQTTVALLDSSNVVQRQVAIDFDAGTMSVNGGPATAFSPSTFDSDLTTALGGQGTASFTNGALSISANGSSVTGVAIDEGTSQKAGRGFSAYFGLNDLVRSNSLATYDTGLTASDANGFTPGDTITLRLSQADGKPLRDVTVAVPAATTMGDLLNALNSNSSGVGLYGQFSLDSNGRMTFTGSQPTNAGLSVVQDTTQRGVGGPSISQLFGLGNGERSSRVDQYKLDPTIAGNPGKLAFSSLDLTATGTQPAIRSGDATGALALAAAGDINTSFGAAGGLGAVSMTVSSYASQFSGSIGRAAADASSRADSATAVKSEADTRLQATEGVNLDEELVNMTTYQQAYNASARMIQATKDLFDILANLIN